MYHDTRSCSQSNFCTVIIFWLRWKFVSRHCTGAHLTNSCMVTQYQPLRTLVPRYAYTPDSLYLDGKNRAMLRSFRPQKNCTLISEFCHPASTRLSSVYSLYCRAVSTNAGRSFELATHLNLFNYTLIQCLLIIYLDNVLTP